jgi:hypothetical protein
MALNGSARHNGFRLNQQDIGRAILKNGTSLVDFSVLSEEKREELRDSDVIDLIDNHIKADVIAEIDLLDCVGITDATLAHIATNCTNLCEDHR